MRLHHVQVSCPVGVEVDFRPAAKAHPALLVEDIEALARKVAQFRFPVVWDEEFTGYRRFYTVDGNDNRVEVLAVGGGA